MPTQTFFNLPAAKRARILELAIEEFAEHDYPQASVSRLVARAGIAKGSFYQYFGSKQGLFEYLLELAAQEKARFLREALAGDGAGSVFDQLRRMLRQGLEFEFTHPGLAQVGYRAYYGDSPLPAEVLQTARQAGREFFHQLVARGQKQGDIDPSLDADLLAWLFSTVFEHLGDYGLERLDVDADDLKQQGVAALDPDEYEPLMEKVVTLLERAAATRGDADAD